MSYREMIKQPIPLEIKGIEYGDVLQILNFLENEGFLEIKDMNTFPFYLIPLICEKYPQVLQNNGFRLRRLYKQYPDHMAQATICSLSASLLDFVAKDAQPVFQPRDITTDYDDLIEMEKFNHFSTNDFYIHAREPKAMAKFLREYFLSGIKANLVLISYEDGLSYASSLEWEIESLFRNSLLDPEDFYPKHKAEFLKKFKIKCRDEISNLAERNSVNYDTIVDLPFTSNPFAGVLPINVNIHKYHPVFDWKIRKLEICDLSPVLNGRQHVEGNPGILMDLLLATNRGEPYQYYGPDLVNEPKIKRFRGIFLMRSECNTMTNIDYEKMRHIFPILYFHKDFNEDCLMDIIRTFWPATYEVGDSHICIMAYYFAEIMKRDPFRTKPIPPELLRFFIEIEDQDYVVIANHEQKAEEQKAEEQKNPNETLNDKLIFTIIREEPCSLCGTKKHTTTSEALGSNTLELEMKEISHSALAPSSSIFLSRPFSPSSSGEEESNENVIHTTEHCECEGLCLDAYECQCNDLYCKCTEKRTHHKSEMIEIEDSEFSPYQKIESGGEPDEFEI